MRTSVFYLPLLLNCLFISTSSQSQIQKIYLHPKATGSEKQQGELKFSAMDLLKKYQNITNGVNAYGTVTRITNGLQQYFLLTVSYYPRKFGKTEIKKQ